MNFDIAKVFKALLLALPLALLWVSCQKKKGYQNRRERFVKEAVAAGRCTTAHFVELQGGVFSVYEYEVDGQVYQWKRALRARTRSTQLPTDDDYFVGGAKENLPETLTLYWEEDHPEKAESYGTISLSGNDAFVYLVPFAIFVVVLWML